MDVYFTIVWAFQIEPEFIETGTSSQTDMKQEDIDDLMRTNKDMMKEKKKENNIYEIETYNFSPEKVPFYTS